MSFETCAFGSCDLRLRSPESLCCPRRLKVIFVSLRANGGTVEITHRKFMEWRFPNTSPYRILISSVIFMWLPSFPKEPEKGLIERGAGLCSCGPLYKGTEGDDLMCSKTTKRQKPAAPSVPVQAAFSLFCLLFYVYFYMKMFNII